LTGQELGVKVASLDSTHLIAGSLGADLSKFATNARPIVIWYGADPVTAIPLPHASYPLGSLLFWVTGARYYRNDGNVWKSSVPADLIAGTIAAGVVFAGTLHSSVVYAGNIQTSQLQAGTINVSLVLNAAKIVATSSGYGVVTIDPAATFYPFTVSHAATQNEVAIGANASIGAQVVVQSTNTSNRYPFVSIFRGPTTGGLDLRYSPAGGAVIAGRVFSTGSYLNLTEVVLQIAGTTAIDASRNVNAATVQIGGTTVIDASRNINNIQNISIGGSYTSTAAQTSYTLLLSGGGVVTFWIRGGIIASIT